MAISISGLLAFGFNLVTNIILIPRYSFPAAAVTTALSYLLLILFEYTFLKRQTDARLIDFKALSPLALGAFALPIYFMRTLTASRLIFALAVVLISLPRLLEFIKAFLERRNEKAI